MSDAFREMLRQMAEAGSGRKPRRRSTDPEHRLQTLCVGWFRAQYPAMRHKLFAVPNGGYRSPKTAAAMKEEGQLAGVSDLIFLHRNSRYGALLIEMKTPEGRQSDRQREWQKAIEAEGYRYVVCRSLEGFRKEIENYLEIER